MNPKDSDSDPPDQRTLKSFGVKVEQQAENEPLRQRIVVVLLDKSHTTAFSCGILFGTICALVVGLPMMLISASGIALRQFVRSLYIKHNNTTHPHRSEVDC